MSGWKYSDILFSFPCWFSRYSVFQYLNDTTTGIHFLIYQPYWPNQETKLYYFFILFFLLLTWFIMGLTLCLTFAIKSNKYETYSNWVSDNVNTLKTRTAKPNLMPVQARLRRFEDFSPLPYLTHLLDNSWEIQLYTTCQWKILDDGALSRTNAKIMYIFIINAKLSYPLN